MAAAFHSSTIRSAMAALAGSGHGSPVKALVSPSSGCAENSVGIKPLRGARKEKAFPALPQTANPRRRYPLVATFATSKPVRRSARRQTASR